MMDNVKTGKAVAKETRIGQIEITEQQVEIFNTVLVEEIAKDIIRRKLNLFDVGPNAIIIPNWMNQYAEELANSYVETLKHNNQ
jgi:hypothetical protein